MGFYITLSPPPELQDYIEYFWETEWDNTSASQSGYLSTASSTGKLIFAFHHLPDNSIKPLFSSVHGQNSSFSSHPVPQQGYFKIFGIRLYPYALPVLFKVSPIELNEQMLSLETLFETFNQSAFQQLSSANTINERIIIFSAFFKKQLSLNKYNDAFAIKAFRQMKMINGVAPVSRLANDFNLSVKQFERKFKNISGFNPKRYSSIARFEQALRFYPKAKSLTDTAYENGYYDQAHFIHDFKKFTGINPKRYFALGFV